MTFGVLGRMRPAGKQTKRNSAEYDRECFGPRTTGSASVPPLATSNILALSNVRGLLWRYDVRTFSAIRDSGFRIRDLEF